MSSSQTGVAAVDRALLILSRVAEHPEGVSLADLSRQTGLYKSTILRLLASLERAGYARRMPDGHYAAGAAPLKLARAYQEGFSLDEVLRPALRALAHASGETASFFVRDGDTRICLRRVESPRSIVIALREGDRLPIDRGSAGKVLRAFANETGADLEQVRNDGWACTLGDRDPAAASMSAPVFGPGNTLQGALALSGPRERFTDEQVARCAPLLREAASTLTRQIGGEQPAARS
ncbi:IclR family transcriptional regulator [Uliginosibacterium sp. H1]|uniref:IclR family transcriptional regulator n=1 Tax=Uliginosibacterium sp. H1 TaxID=3114757 RepID=UPI002E17940A|nr:IclR family transcriptional regulator [Uliginosibacterium sp. H1]